MALRILLLYALLSASQNGYFAGLDGDPGKIRTSDLRFRKPSLYPPELRGRFRIKCLQTA